MTPRAWLDTPARVAMGLLLLSGCFSIRTTSVVDGVVVYDMDYGSGGLALCALGGFLYAAGKAVELEDDRRLKRLGLLYGLSFLSLLRAWAQFGFWPL